jgi:hypothetical protein
VGNPTRSIGVRSGSSGVGLRIVPCCICLTRGFFPQRNAMPRICKIKLFECDRTTNATPKIEKPLLG